MLLDGEKADQKSDAGEEVCREGQATIEQMREVGTGVWMGGAVR